MTFYVSALTLGWVTEMIAGLQKTRANHRQRFFHRTGGLAEDREIYVFGPELHKSANIWCNVKGKQDRVPTGGPATQVHVKMDVKMETVVIYYFGRVLQSLMPSVL